MDDAGDDHLFPLEAANLDVDVDVPVDDGWIDEAFGVGDEEPSKSIPDPQCEGQLIITFQGVVHVFDEVSPQKVQALLFLLSEPETPADVTDVRPVLDLTPKDSEEVSQSESSANAYRHEALMRYREKKKRRNLMNRAKYENKQDAASRMKRQKGQFASSRANIDAEGNPSNENNGQEEINLIRCQNCGISKDETPMMRRGPNGPRSLCNSCGLKWANTGMLRIPPKVPSSMDENPQVNKIDQGIPQIPNQVPSSVDKDLRVNKIDQIDISDITVSDFSWDDLIIVESAETGRAGNES